MVRLSAFDTHAKTIDGVHTRTSLGAVLSLFAGATALWLFVSSVGTYLQVDVERCAPWPSAAPLRFRPAGAGFPPAHPAPRPPSPPPSFAAT